MTSVSRKINSRRRLAAITFLSNISLDGTHKDTNLGDLNFNVQFKKSTCNRNVSVEHVENAVNVRATNPSSIETSITQYGTANKIIKSSTTNEGKILCRRQSEDKLVNLYRFDDQHQQTKNKDRMHKFVSDAKARLSNLSQKRKQLTHQKSSDSYGLPSGRSTESLVVTGGCRSRKASLCPSECSFPSTVEVKFLRNLSQLRNDAERFVLVSGKKSPVVLFSILPYCKSQGSVKGDTRLEGSRRRHASSRQLAVITDGPDPLDLLTLLGVEKPQEGQDISYGKLLDPSITRNFQCFFDPWSEVENFRFPYQVHSTAGNPDHMSRISFKLSSTPPKSLEKCLEKEEAFGRGLPWQMCSSYNPNLLDDPELIAGKHSTLLIFSSYITSVIDYVKPSDLKRDLNDKFRERFPHIQLTLSKLRSLKREMYKIARHECNIDLSVVAQAFVYFEKLILKILVNKQNRKHCAAACLLLSAKLNDVKGLDLRNLLEKIETVFRINRKDLMSLEFGVLVALDFSLLLNASEILPHYQRLVYES